MVTKSEQEKIPYFRGLRGQIKEGDYVELNNGEIFKVNQIEDDATLTYPLGMKLEPLFTFTVDNIPEGFITQTSEYSSFTNEGKIYADSPMDAPKNIRKIHKGKFERTEINFIPNIGDILEDDEHNRRFLIRDIEWSPLLDGRHFKARARELKDGKICQSSFLEFSPTGVYEIFASRTSRLSRIVDSNNNVVYDFNHPTRRLGKTIKKEKLVSLMSDYGRF